jgi:two-component system sensor histidine kinase/response regulator
MDEPPVDTRTGLQRAAGRQALYGSLLKLYAEQGGVAGERLRAALAQGDLAGAQRLAHTLKGSSAQVGAAQVERRAALLEDRLREGAPADQVQPLLAELEQALRETLDWLAAGPLRAPPA